MFVAHLCGEIRAAGFVGPGHADGAAHELRQVVQRPDEEGVVGGSGDGLVELEVFLHAIPAALHGAIQGLHRLLQPLHVRAVRRWAARPAASASSARRTSAIWITASRDSPWRESKFKGA